MPDEARLFRNLVGPKTYSSPENWELEKVIRQLGNLLHKDARVDWPEPRKRYDEVLWEVGSTCPKSRALAERLEGLELVVGGSEHVLIRLEDEPNRIFKVTFQSNFGCKSDFFRADPELTGRHFHAGCNEDPVFYLQRWIWLNSISEYQTRYEGILPPETDQHLPRICVSQPFLEGENPQEPAIEKALAQYGYRKISADAFLNDDSHILLTDVAPRNVRIVDKVPVPFDAIAEIASEKVLEWACV